MHRIAFLLSLSLAGVALAEEPLIERARETLQRIRDQRQQRDAAQAAPAQATWGHHLVKPDPLDLPVGTPEKQIPRPDIKPVGTISVWGGIKVVVGKEAFGVGEEIVPGWRVRAIVGRKLYIEHEKLVLDYQIP